MLAVSGVDAFLSTLFSFYIFYVFQECFENIGRMMVNGKTKLGIPTIGTLIIVTLLPIQYFSIFLVFDFMCLGVWIQCGNELLVKIVNCDLLYYTSINKTPLRRQQVERLTMVWALQAIRLYSPDKTLWRRWTWASSWPAIQCENLLLRSFRKDFFKEFVTGDKSWKRCETASFFQTY